MACADGTAVPSEVPGRDAANREELDLHRALAPKASSRSEAQMSS